MDNRPMTPTQIATQAAEALLRQEYESVSGVFGEAYGPHPHDIERVSRLILSAAAKMVQRSGATVWAVYHNGTFQDARPTKREAECYASGYSTPCEIREVVIFDAGLLRSISEGEAK